MAVEFHNTSSAFVKKLMDSFVTFMCHCSCLPTLHLVSLPYTPRMQLLFPPDVHYKSGNSKHQYTHTNCTKCVDTNFSTFHSNNLNNPSSAQEKPPKLITVKKPIHVLWLPPACSATSPHFHLPPWYEHPALAVNISLDIANLNMVNISSLDFDIWQHLKDYRNETQLYHLSSIPSVPIAQLYKHMISGIKPITPFTTPNE